MTKDSVSSFSLPEIRDFLNNVEMVSATRDLYGEGRRAFDVQEVRVFIEHTKVASNACKLYNGGRNPGYDTNAIHGFLETSEAVIAARESYTRQSADFGFDVKSALSLVDTELAATASDCYQKLSVNRPKPYFNFFKIIKRHYWENMHSDILKEFLDPRGSHGQGNMFLQEFIQVLKKFDKSGKINPADFEDAEVKREKHRIDITIHSLNSDKTIVIENKINYAVDQPEQLGGYFKTMKDNKREVVAMVYLTPYGTKRPEEHSYGKSKELIEEVFINLPAHNHQNESGNDSGRSVVAWLKTCQNKIDERKDLNEPEDSNDYQNLSVFLKQYIKLIEVDTMNQEQMKEFYQLLCENEENYQKAFSVMMMMTKVRRYLVVKILNEFRNKYSSTFNIAEWNDDGEGPAKDDNTREHILKNCMGGCCCFKNLKGLELTMDVYPRLTQDKIDCSIYIYSHSKDPKKIHPLHTKLKKFNSNWKIDDHYYHRECLYYRPNNENLPLMSEDDIKRCVEELGKITDNLNEVLTEIKKENEQENQNN